MSDPKNPSSPNNPRVFLELSTGVANKPLGKIIIELYANFVPKTAENFRALCTGEKGFGYKGSIFHRVIPNFMIQGGDITKNDGTGGKSIYEEKFFKDENFYIKHGVPGSVSMANLGSNINGSQFFITAVPTPDLNGKNVVFGRVIEGLKVVDSVTLFGSANGKPSQKITITNCGQL